FHKSALFSFLINTPPPTTPTLFPYTTLFRSQASPARGLGPRDRPHHRRLDDPDRRPHRQGRDAADDVAREGPQERRDLRTAVPRSEEHTSELQSLAYLVCRLLLEKKKKNSLL